MKKIMMIFCTLVLMSGLSSMAMAVTYTDTVSLNTLLVGTGTYNWQHNTPTDLDVPPDEVTEAILKIWALGVDGHNDEISAEGQFQGTLTNGVWSWSNPLWLSESVFDVANVFTQWSGGNKLDVSLSYSEGLSGLYSLMLKKSELTIAYNQGSNSVPEPTTLLLLGFGLVGLAGAGRKLKK